MVQSENGDESKDGDKRKKRYHRRSPWACDECRLRKRKCDGKQPCGPCHDIDHACTYEFRRPAKAPTARIRDLENHLRYAQSFIKDLQQRKPAIDGVDFDSALQALDFSAPESVPVPKEECKVKLASMMVGHQMLMNNGMWSTNFYGFLSGFSFVTRTLEIFQMDDTNSHENRLCITELFDKPMPDIRERPPLPHRALASDLIAAAFARCPFMQVVQEDFQPMVRQVYDSANPMNSPFLPLLHMVLAVGYLRDVKFHQNSGCGVAVQEATKFFLLGRASIDFECKDLLALQVIIAAAVFLISTCRIVSAHTLLGPACSAILRLGLHSGISVGDSAVDAARARTLAVILNMDIYASLVLGLPPLLRFQDTQIAISTQDQEGAALAKHIDLMRLMSTSRESLFDQHSDIDFKQLADVESSLQQWAKEASTMLANFGDDIPSQVTKHELETTYMFAHIILFRPFLHYLRHMVDGAAIPLSQSQHALACLKIASSTIVRSERVMKKGVLCSASWKSIYTLFLSIMCLVFLIAAHNGISQPSEAYRKAVIGIRVLAACRCSGDGATACLQILKMVVRQLKHTVSFDIDQIESSTPPLCRIGMENIESPDTDMSTPSQAKLSLAHILHGPEVALSDADRMLAQAEEMEMEFGFEDLMYLDEISR